MVIDNPTNDDKNRNARPNNHQLKIYYLCVRYLLIKQQYPVNNTNNTFSVESKQIFMSGCEISVSFLQLVNIAR